MGFTPLPILCDDNVTLSVDPAFTVADGVVDGFIFFPASGQAIVSLIVPTSELLVMGTDFETLVAKGALRRSLLPAIRGAVAFTACAVPCRVTGVLYAVDGVNEGVAGAAVLGAFVFLFPLTSIQSFETIGAVVGADALTASFTDDLFSLTGVGVVTVVVDTAGTFSAAFAFFFAFLLLAAEAVAGSAAAPEPCSASSSSPASALV